MWKLFIGFLAGAGAFSAERGAELMWPEGSPLIWWSISAAVFVLLLVLAYVGGRYFSDREAVKRNPGNGFRVSRLIMKARTIASAKKLFRDFEALPSSQKANELDVLAAYGLRMWRTNTGIGGWELACVEELAQSRGLGGRYPFFESYKRLDAEFPESWWSKLLGKRRVEAERLHDEICAILMDNRNAWMTTKQIAERVTERNLHRAKHGSSVCAFQIHRRTRHRPNVFERDGQRVRCKEE